MRLPRKLPSPAAVLASAALLVALGGTGVAAVVTVPRASVGTAELRNGAVTTAKIKNGNVTSADIADGGVSSADVRNGSLRRVDFRPGQIPHGPTGPQGPPGVSGREQVASETPLTSASPKNLTATCPAGKKVLGGGVEISGAGRARVTAVENHPAGDNAWEAEAWEAVATGATWKVVVHAICATVAP
ncbi:MAG TPA: hypothetical protein VFG70_02330 [Gaiellaceae bacterium]|nr:hypothetical protein [Gaiellaceae bacterium]